MNAVTFTPEHDRAIKSFALKAWRRAQAAGARSLQLEDVQQELMCAWCVARDKWDATQGVPFLAYLRNGMKLAINRWLQAQIDFGQTYSLDDEGDDERSGHETTADHAALDGIEVFERDDARAAIEARLGGMAATFVRLLRDPPDFLMEGVRARQARKAFAREQGLTPPSEPERVTAAMILDFMDASATERTRIYGELKRVADEQNRRVVEVDTRFAPGCFGSPHCYQDGHTICGRCSYAPRCAPEALKRKLTLQAHFGIKPKVEKIESPAPAPAPKKPRPKLSPQILLIAKALRLGKNPFNKAKTPTWWLTADILLHHPDKASFKVMVYVLRKILGDAKRAGDQANRMLLDLRRAGAVIKQGDLYVIKGAKR